MAFLDNSGDIILDAVLTETGRRKMAQGTFRIVRFALGDDEIDYALYNKDHPSGSAYYDLEILQTPVFEALTQVNAGINYGLLGTTALDLLYMPVMSLNQLTTIGSTTSFGNVASTDNVFYIADSSNDSSTNTIANALTTDGKDFIAGDKTPTSFVFAENGINSGWNNSPLGTMANQTNYLIANALVDKSYYVFYDNRYFNGAYGPAVGSSFDNNTQTMALEAGTSTSIDHGLANYSGVRLRALRDNIYWQADSTFNEQDYSVIEGPRGTCVAVAPQIVSGLDAEYELNGGDITINSIACKFIDSTIYVQGNLSHAQVQIPVRIVKIA